MTQGRYLWFTTAQINVLLNSFSVVLSLERIYFQNYPFTKVKFSIKIFVSTQVKYMLVIVLLKKVNFSVSTLIST